MKYCWRRADQTAVTAMMRSRLRQIERRRLPIRQNVLSELPHPVRVRVSVQDDVIVRGNPEGEG
jgi:hypothetical protein